MNELSALNLSDVPTAGATGDGAITSAAGDALGRDAFLKLLTTQMQNQDPLSPMSNEEFVAQLAQFSSLEQLMGISAGLDSVYLGIASMNNASMSNLIGQEITAIGDGVSWDGENPVELNFESSAPADTATLTVYDEQGSVVFSSDLGPLGQGEGVAVWDGNTTSGAPADPGNYTFTVTATDADGESVQVEEHVVGTIDEMDFSTGTPMPSVNGVNIDVADILKLSSPHKEAE